MLAFRIEVDGHPPFLAGVEDWAVLSVHVNAVRAEAYQRETDDFDFSAGGMSRDDENGVAYHFRWPRIPLKLGSTVRVTLVEAENVALPAKRYRADREIQENPFTEEEWREMRRQDYLKLKAEFEGNA